MGEAQEWWRAYDCENCHKSNRCVRATPMVFVAAEGRANAAWLHTTRPACLTAMARYGFGKFIQPIQEDKDPSYTVFRPMSKAPPNKMGLGYHGSASASASANSATAVSDSQPVQPPLIIREYMTATTQPLNEYEKAYEALRLPAPDTRALKTLVQAHTSSNSNGPFRRRMLSIIQEGDSDDVMLWQINNREELARHDLVRNNIQKTQVARAAAAVLSIPTKWQRSASRRAAEQQKRISYHYFHAVSSGDQAYIPAGPPPTQPSSPPQLSRAASSAAAAPPPDHSAWPEGPGSHTQLLPSLPLQFVQSGALNGTGGVNHTHHTLPQPFLPQPSSSLGHGNTSYLHHQAGPPPPPPPFFLPPPSSSLGHGNTSYLHHQAGPPPPPFPQVFLPPPTTSLGHGNTSQARPPPPPLLHGGGHNARQQRKLKRLADGTTHQHNT